MYVFVCACVFVCVCVFLLVCSRVRACSGVCVCAIVPLMLIDSSLYHGSRSSANCLVGVSPSQQKGCLCGSVATRSPEHKTPLKERRAKRALRVQPTSLIRGHESIGDEVVVVVVVF